MVHIAFDYEPESKSVTNIKVTDLVVSAPKGANTIALHNANILQLNQKVVDDLGVKVGDRLCLRFNNGPILATPHALGEDGGGNLITKSFTISCKGKAGVELRKYGNKFDHSLTSEGVVKLVPLEAQQVEEVTTETPKDDTKTKEIHKVEDTTFSLPPADGQEVSFEF